MEDMPYIEIPLHGKYGEGKVTLVDGDYDGEYFSQFKWYVNPKGYAVRQDGYGRDGRKLVYLHHEVLPTDKAKAGHIVRDHIDGNKLNNRSCNLRLVSHGNNMRNSVSKAKSGFKGVWKREAMKTRPYQVLYKPLGATKVKHIGYYRTAKEAAVAYNNAAVADGNTFAKLNEV